MIEPTDSFREQAETVRGLVQEGYRVFGRRKLKHGFVERCSPMSDRQDIAAKIHASGDPKLISDEVLALYSFRALTTMGDEDDLLYVLPRLFDLVTESVVDPDAAWNGYDTLWPRKVAALVEGSWLTDDELSFVGRFVDALWILTLLVIPKRWYLIPEFLKEVRVLYPQARFLDAWLSTEAVEAIDPLQALVTDDLSFPRYQWPKSLQDWLDSEPVLEKVVPRL